MRNYTRWTQDEGPVLEADILGASYALYANSVTGKVTLQLDDRAVLVLSPDESRMLGVRLIEGAALADGERAIRRGA